MGKKKEFIIWTDQEDMFQTYLTIEGTNGNTFNTTVTLPNIRGHIEEVINAVELLKENIQYLLDELVEHAQELEDEEKE